MSRAKEGSAPGGDAPQLTNDDSTAPLPNAVAPRGVSLYVGDLFAATKGLVHAHYELWAMLQRHTMNAEIAEAIEEMAIATGELVDLAKFVQDRLRGIDWHDRPELHAGWSGGPQRPPLSPCPHLSLWFVAV